MLEVGTLIRRWAGIALILSTHVCGAQEQIYKHPISVSDIIEMKSFKGPGGDHLDPDSVAQFSPNGQRFVVVLRTPDLERNENHFSLLLFETKNVRTGTKPRELLTMSSSSNREAIRSVKWLSDNDTLTFLGENPGETPQVYKLDVSSQHLERLTHHSSSSAIASYDASSDASVIAFVTEAPTTRPIDTEKIRHEGVLIDHQVFEDIIAGHPERVNESELFVQQRGAEPVRVSMDDAILEPQPEVAPDGRYVLVRSYIRDVPAAWSKYQDEFMHDWQKFVYRKISYSNILRYQLVSTRTALARPLVNAPSPGSSTARITADSRTAIVTSTYLPLDVANAQEAFERERKQYDVEVDLGSGRYHPIQASEAAPNQRSIKVALKQDENTPAVLVARDNATGRETILLDPNPQFRQLEFGAVRAIDLNVGDIDVIGSLYLPPDYVVGKQYPLVIQTHGYVPGEFSMDGRSEWSSAFAARALAANGIVTFQAQAFKNQQDHDRVAHDRRFGFTAAQSFKRFSMAVYEAAIDRLDHDGVIDRTKVGISGFSRTVCFVAYALTHSRYNFAAASLVDGIDCGYFLQVVDSSDFYDSGQLNGGAVPFGPGLKTWLSEAPAFNLDKVSTPVWFVAIGPYSIVQQWEWFTGLTALGKPVELLEIPDGVHEMQKPWERRTAQQGMVDWFTFWLKGDEGPDPSKREQYARWHELRDKQEGKRR